MAADQHVSKRMNASGQQPGFAVWLTGLPASGKTTLAKTLQHRLAAQDVQVLLLDSDELREVLIAQSTYTKAERDWFYGVIARLAAWLASNGINVLIAATANRRAYRQAARQQIARFAEVYVLCSPETCRQRDPKGLYALSQQGVVSHLPGEGDIYEPPIKPEAVINTDELDPPEAAATLFAQLADLWT